MFVNAKTRNQTDLSDEMNETPSARSQASQRQRVRSQQLAETKTPEPGAHGKTIQLTEPDPADSKPEAVASTFREPTSRYEKSSALTIYMRELGQVELLTPEEEIQLAAKIKKGNPEARERMIRANLRLVVKIARDYEGLGVPLLDLINEGNIGLMSAVERFDPAKGAKLSTYGSWWIKQSIRRAIANQAKTIRLPVHMVDKIYHMYRVSLKLQETLGREPTDEETAAELGITTRAVGAMRIACARPASLDAPLGDDENARLADIVRDEQATSPYEQLEEKTVTDMLTEMIDRLQPREASVLRFRFGLDGGPERTLEEVGEKFGVTRERIRQLQNLALKKLRRMIKTIEPVPEAA
jgi:RNA polymerase primary sigma factor